MLELVWVRVSRSSLRMDLFGKGPRRILPSSSTRSNWKPERKSRGTDFGDSDILNFQAFLDGREKRRRQMSDWKVECDERKHSSFSNGLDSRTRPCSLPSGKPDDLTSWASSATQLSRNSRLKLWHTWIVTPSLLTVNRKQVAERKKSY